MPIPVVAIGQMREWEQATWAAGRTEAEVIRRVGSAVARLALSMTQPGASVLILAGKGHNGEDAKCAQEHLHGRNVELIEVADPAADFRRLEEALARKPGLIIDGLFGIGLNRPLSEEWVSLIQHVNQGQSQVLAVDVPSGLNADTGEMHGAAIRADCTLTVGAPKRGLLTQTGRATAGRIAVASDVGLVPCPVSSDLLWTTAEDFKGFPPVRSVETHKGSHGHVAIVAGSMGYHGAAVLAARGAQRAQPGLITVQTQENVYFPVAAQMQAAMVNVWQPNVRVSSEYSSAVLGPGLASPEVPTTMKAFVRATWRDAEIPVVVDASGLDWVPLEAPPRLAIRVLTPHPGEAARLLSLSTQKVQADRVDTLRRLSKRYGNAWVVLKGHQTLIGRSSGPVYVNSSGNPHLAQGGSGDVLSGYIGGFLAQPALRTDVALTLRYAVLRHGAAADSLQERKRDWTIEEFIDELGAAPPIIT
jgi:NAD(P)H-hydrate epimerase